MSSNSKGDVSSEKLDTPIVEKAHLLWTQPFLNALYDFITFFSPEDATPPASDSNLTDRFWGIVLRLFFLILLAPFPLSPSERSPNSVSPSTLAQVKYPLLLFAVANTRQNCGDSLPLYHSILALGILFCSFVGDYSSWENISIENVGPAVLLGAVEFVLAVTFRNRPRNLVVCGLRQIQSLDFIVIPSVPDASMIIHGEKPRGFRQRARDAFLNAFDSVIASLSPLDAPPASEDPQLVYRLFSLTLRLGIFAYFVFASGLALPVDLLGYLKYAFLAFAFYLRQGIDIHAPMLHRAAPLYHSLMSACVPWSFAALYIQEDSDADNPGLSGDASVAAAYGIVAFFLAITFRSRPRHITLWGLERA